MRGWVARHFSCRPAAAVSHGPAREGKAPAGILRGMSGAPSSAPSAPASTPPPASPSDLQWNRANLIGLGFLHLASLAGILWMALVQFHWGTLALGVLWYGLGCVGITGGYHRSFAHKAYDTAALLRWFYLLFGAAAMQTSALVWSADHRDHHRHTDDDDDPHSILEGFFWAHMGWIIRNRADRPGPNLDRVQDLARIPGFQWQHRYYWPIAIVMGWVVPALIALAWGDFIGALLVAGALRTTLMLHATWCVNSVAHTIGSRPYSRAISARDSLLTALITGGEGYHNFHHRFPGDYRNAIRWWQYDPTKWFIWTMSKVGLARGLQRTPVKVIAAARQQVRGADAA